MRQVSAESVHGSWAWSPIAADVANIWLLALRSISGGALFGFDISSMSGVLGTQAYKRFFGYPTSFVQGAITASMPAGSLTGALASSMMADRLSRKKAVQVSCIFWIVGSVVQCTAQGVGMLCAGRAVAGLCVGMTSSIVPVYQAEIAPKGIRGRVVRRQKATDKEPSYQQWAITWGILIQFFIQYGAAESISGGPRDPNQSTNAFRIPWAVQMVPALGLFVGLFFCPHSPRWLASKDRWHEALVVLGALHEGTYGSATRDDGSRRMAIHDPRVRAQYQEIEDALRCNREDADGSFAALGKGRMLRRVVLGISIQAWSQLCGMNIMMCAFALDTLCLASGLWSSTGFANSRETDYIVYVMEGAEIGSPLLTASIQYIINVVLTTPAIFYLDKWGRRPSLIVGSFLMMTCLFTSGALQQYYGQPNTALTITEHNKAITWVVVGHRAASWGIVVLSYLFVATFATTWGPTSWTYPAEIFPSRLRARAVSLCTATNWLFNMVLAFAVPPLTYYIFGAINAAAFVHMYLTARETKGYTLEEMEEVFDGGRYAWQTKKAPASRLEGMASRIEAEAESTQQTHGPREKGSMPCMALETERVNT
ncbi:MFS sugar transporter-like protein [Purpureocillium lavendulum]|uniref:MFS sugar transporter-like protein n=1 Tax=Purpureocillium lavendulum TaxID=1247861 RepID=A0AB34FK70_9HYPO|nr:MFS sugar transporter-like protein [Purpureocillium lavendulum]